MSDSAKKQKTKQQPEDNSNFSTIPELINEQIIDKLAPSTYNAKIFVFPQWDNDILND